MLQVVEMNTNDGKTRQLNLPEMDQEGLITLGLSLKQVRMTCITNTRAFQPNTPWDKNFRTNISAGAILDVMCDRLRLGIDKRKKIVELPENTFYLLITLAYDVAQDSANMFDPFKKVLIGFGLMEPIPAK
jgi:hypothetical protein